MERSNWMVFLLLFSATDTAAITMITPNEPVIFGAARFSPISPSLIRLEFGTEDVWDPRPTLSYPGGRATVLANHTVTYPSADTITVTTDELILRYNRSASSGGMFTNASLSIMLRRDPGTVWRPGDLNLGNLGGSRLDLGCYATFESCYSNGVSPGPLSTSGWSLMDDTVGVRMQTEDDPELGFPWYDSSHPCDRAGVCGPTQVDWYFFGHGHRYRDALQVCMGLGHDYILTFGVGLDGDDL